MDRAEGKTTGVRRWLPWVITAAVLLTVIIGGYLLVHKQGAAQHLIEKGGYAVLFALLFACGLGMPLPEDIPLLMAGFLISQGKMQWVFAAVAAWCGIIGGDIVLYHLGKKFGPNITRLPVVGKHMTRERIERVEKLFERWGVWVVAILRLFAGVRGAMVVAAGIIRYSLVKFVIADGLAAIVSGGLFMGLGYWVGRIVGNPFSAEAQARIAPYKFYLLGGAAVLAGLIVLYVIWRKRKHKSLAEIALARVEKAAKDEKPTSGQ